MARWATTTLGSPIQVVEQLGEPEAAVLDAGGQLLVDVGHVLGIRECLDAGNQYPAAGNGINDVIAIGGGMWHSVALKVDGTVWACGNNSYGQLANGTLDGSTTPAQAHHHLRRGGDLLGWLARAGAQVGQHRLGRGATTGKASSATILRTPATRPRRWRV
jgi:hypothetical protein